MIGHEITHAFDDRGRQHNAEGNLIDWWQSDTKKNFLDRAQCIIEQYASFRDPLTNLTVNIIFFHSTDRTDTLFDFHFNNCPNCFLFFLVKWNKHTGRKYC